MSEEEEMIREYENIEEGIIPEKAIDIDGLAKLLKSRPDVLEALNRKIETVEEKVTWSKEKEESYLNEWREKVEDMNEKQKLVDDSEPFRLVSFKGSLSQETGEPIALICDLRNDDMNVIGEKLYMGYKPKFSGIYEKLVFEHGESSELYEGIPKMYHYDDEWEQYVEEYDFEPEDVDFDS